MQVPRRRRAMVPYEIVNVRSPLARDCPKCGAKRGYRCLNMRRGPDSGGVDRILSPHRDRRRPKEGQ
jgi:hypothetical protein